MRTSVIMTAYKRSQQLDRTLESIATQTRRPDQVVVVEDGFDGGATQDVCVLWKGRGLPIEYICRKNRPDVGYSNPAIPKNIGIKHATGDILIIQCGEVMYTDREDVAKLVRPLEESKYVSMIATVSARDEQGSFQEWYAGPKRDSKLFLDFCQSVHRQDVLAIGGFDEQYEGYGFDDSDFALRLQASGVQYRWALDVECYHQWHFISRSISAAGRSKYDHAKEEVLAGRRSPVANVGRLWGDLNS